MASGLPDFLPVALIIDGDADTAEMYAVALSLEGFTTVEAHAADQVMDWIHRTPPDVVITGLNLEGPTDGIGLVRALRDHPRTRHIPVIVVGASTGEWPGRAALAAGCDLVLPKPCEIGHLAAQAEALVYRSHTAAAGEQATPDGPRP